MSSHGDTELYYTDKTSALLSDMPDYVKKYIRSIHNRTAPRTRYEYLRDIKMFLDYIKQTHKITTVELQTLNYYSKEDFEEYFEYLEHYKTEDKDRSNGRTSIKRKMSSLRKFFAYLFENDLIESDKIRKIEMPKLHSKEIIRLDENEVSTLLSVVENGGALTKKQNDYHKIQSVRDMAIITLLLSTGLRVSECAELDLSDVNINKSSLHIVRKGGNEATVYFSDEASEYLSAYIETRVQIKNCDEQALFLSSRKTRLSVRAIEALVEKYTKRSVPNKHITPHKLRATYATNLYNATGDIYLVAETLGHKDVATTKEHYANLSEKRKEDSRNKICLKKKA